MRVVEAARLAPEAARSAEVEANVQPWLGGDVPRHWKILSVSCAEPFVAALLSAMGGIDVAFSRCTGRFHAVGR